MNHWAVFPTRRAAASDRGDHFATIVMLPLS